MDNDFRVNEESRQFEMDVEGQMAIITYIRQGNIISLNHTEVPKELQGKGVANEIVDKTLNYIKEQNLKVVPSCSFVSAFVARHPEWKSIVS
ncbi:MAG TPA: GNAT family N-acetyltransferase [Flavobacterium sp.]|jgi:hypothetical protein